MTTGGRKTYHLRALERQDSANILMLIEFADDEKSVQEWVICLDGVIENFPQALKVLHSFTVSATFASRGGHLTMEITQWYEPCLGLLRAQVARKSAFHGTVFSS